MTSSSAIRLITARGEIADPRPDGAFAICFVNGEPAYRLSYPPASRPLLFHERVEHAHG